jgi:guanylate kinase
MSSEDAPAAGTLLVVSAPSGAGKTTIVERLAERVPRLVVSRSYTSRAIRPAETAGVDYNFIERAEFERMIAGDEFLEWADVFGSLYGTRAADTDRLLAAGDDVVLVIDVQGARQVRARRPGVVSVFVLPPSFDVLERRLRGRSQDPEEAIARRLATARAEVGRVVDYDYVVVNDEVEACVDRLRAIVLAERARRDRMAGVARGIIGTFGAAAAPAQRDR